MAELSSLRAGEREERGMSEQASIERLRWAAEGARGVADGNEDVLRDAANIDLAAAELEAHRALLSKLRRPPAKPRIDSLQKERNGE